MQLRIVGVAALVGTLTCAIQSSNSDAHQPRQAASTVIYLTSGDTTQNCYRLFRPSAPRALLVLLPEYGGTVDSFANARIPGLLAARGVATIIVSPTPVGTGYLDDDSLSALDAIISDATSRLRIARDRFAIGGFSAGGTGAVRYAERCGSGALQSSPAPAAVFGVDPPLDFERWWRGMELLLRRGTNEQETGEAHAILDALRYNLGGSPDEAPEAYLRTSPLMAFAPDGGNARLLRGMPIRLYTEPDIGFWIDHYAADYYSINAIDAAAMINQLHVLGNTRAQLVVTHGKGVRPDLGGIRLPHAWSIVDEADLSRWLVACLSSDARSSH